MSDIIAIWLVVFLAIQVIPVVIVIDILIHIEKTLRNIYSMGELNHLKWEREIMALRCKECGAHMVRKDYDTRECPNCHRKVRNNNLSDEMDRDVYI